MGEKSCEIKGGSHEMAVMMLLIINLNNAQHHCNVFMAATFDFTTFSPRRPRPFNTVWLFLAGFPCATYSYITDYRYVHLWFSPMLHC